MRTLIYARYSSDLQNARSIADQVALCRGRCDREGWTVVDVFTDAAISGAAGLDESQRPGMNALLARLDLGGIDQVLAESTSRIARDRRDGFEIRERINFAGARLFTLSHGEINDITGWVTDFLDAQQRKDLAFNVRRGQAGTVRSGRIPAGIAYGYRKAPRLDEKGELVRGERAIDPDQAGIVRRIFREYAAGSSARMIAAGLNADGIPGPTGGKWRASTIAGDRKRGNGILQNRLYIGEIVHFRTRKRPDPRTRRPRIRPNDAAEHVVGEAPDLALIDRALWDEVQAQRTRFGSMASHPERARRPRHLLSGLGTCAVCGGTWTVIGRDRWGCGRYRDGRGCTNNRTIMGHLYEAKVIEGLSDQMLDPRLVTEFVREFHRDHARKSAELGRDRTRIERRIAEAGERIGRLVDAIERGAGIREVVDRLEAARADKAAAEAELRELESLPVLTLHPNIADLYRAEVAQLDQALAGDEHARREAMPIVRGLIATVLLRPHPTRARGVEIEVKGRLAALLHLATGGAPVDDMYGNAGAGRAAQSLSYDFLKAVI